MRKWTKLEVDFLCDNLSTLSLSKIGQQLGRSKGSVNGKIVKLGIREFKDPTISEGTLKKIYQFFDTYRELRIQASALRKVRLSYRTLKRWLDESCEVREHYNQVEIWLNSTRKCSYCGMVDTPQLFVKQKKDRKFSVCKVCHITRYKERRNSLNGRLRAILASLKSRDKNSDITLEHLFYLWESQNGLCYYTHEEMTLISNAVKTRDRPHNLISIDRVDSKKGYMKDNVVFCCFKINTIKNDLSLLDLVDVCRKIVRIHG